MAKRYFALLLPSGVFILLIGAYDALYQAMTDDIFLIQINKLDARYPLKNFLHLHQPRTLAIIQVDLRYVAGYYCL